MNPIIKVENLTKDYGDGKGIFDINFSVNKGEVFGFVGTNGSGKTTTIRHLMGFLKPQSGNCYINSLDCWKDSTQIKQFVSYVPGEIAFPDLRTGTEFLKAQAELLGLKNMDKANYLCQKLQLDTTANLKRMSKGMKQKTAIVATFMADKEILILDEPTTGLDPLMRETFLELILEEKDKGKTIFMSSHMFDELEDTCDKVALIYNGKIIDVTELQDIDNMPTKTYKIEFLDKENYQKFKRLKYVRLNDKPKYNQVTIQIENDKINQLLKTLSGYSLKYIAEIKFSLEKHFRQMLKKYNEGQNV